MTRVMAMIRMVFEIVMVLAVVSAVFFMMKVASKEDSLQEQTHDDNLEK